MKKQIMLAVVLACASMPSLAANFYLLADAGQSKYEVDIGKSTVSRNENVVSIGGGYNVNSHVAVELAYRDMGEMSGEEVTEYNRDDYVVLKETVSVSALQISVLGSLPLGEAAKLYGRFGFADLEIEAEEKITEYYDGDFSYSSASDSVSKTKAVFGFGLSYSFTPAFALRGEYSQYGEWEDLTISTTTIGLTYQF